MDCYLRHEREKCKIALKCTGKLPLCRYIVSLVIEKTAETEQTRDKKSGNNYIAIFAHYSNI